MESARLRFGPSVKVVVMIDRPAGAVNAALAPFRKRVSTSSVPESTRPPASEASVNTDSPASRTFRLPSRSAMRPPSSSSPP